MKKFTLLFFLVAFLITGSTFAKSVVIEEPPDIEKTVIKEVVQQNSMISNFGWEISEINLIDYDESKFIEITYCKGDYYITSNSKLFRNISEDKYKELEEHLKIRNELITYQRNALATKTKNYFKNYYESSSGGLPYTNFHN